MRPTISLVVWAPIALALAFLPPRALNSQEQTVTLDLFLDMESASNPRISPDGQQIIFTRGGIEVLFDFAEFVT